MDCHHVVEAAGAVALALVFYSYTWRWFDAAESPRRARWRPVVNGVAFGLLAVFLMRSRIQVGEDRWVDARSVPLALIALMEGPLAGAIAGGIAVARRLWLGGPGAVAGAGRGAAGGGDAAGARGRPRDQQSPPRGARRTRPRRAQAAGRKRGGQVDRARARGRRAHPRHRRAHEPHHADRGSAADRDA